MKKIVISLLNVITTFSIDIIQYFFKKVYTFIKKYDKILKIVKKQILYINSKEGKYEI